MLTVSKNVNSRVLIRPVDTGVVVLAVAFYFQIDNFKELLSHLALEDPVHHIPINLGALKCRALPLLHAIVLSCQPCDAPEESAQNIERFVIVMYQKTCGYSSRDDARRDLFTRGRSMSTTPPTSGSLFEHVKRAVLQAGHIWSQSLVARPNLPRPANLGLGL